MKENSFSKLGGNCSILVGILYVLIGITYLLLPAAQKGASLIDPVQFFPSYTQEPTILTFLYCEFALLAVFAIAAVFAISKKVQSINESWLRWTTNLAFLGYSVMAISYLRGLYLIPKISAAFEVGDASTKAAIVAPGVAGWNNLDPQGWLTFGCVGFWLLVVSLLVLRSDKLPKGLAYIGIVGALANWLVVAGQVAQIEKLISIAAGLGGVIAAPIWFIWMGVTLRQSSS